MQMTKTRVSEIDVLKGIAIIAVLTIHTTSNAVVTLEKSSLSYILFTSINRLAQFAVPAFIFASAMLLTYNYSDKLDIGVFYKKRFKNVIFPYISWIVIYGAYLVVRYHMPLKSILTVQNLLLGGMFYHMYFIVIIVQLYLLFPLLLYLYKLINKNIYTVVISIVLLQIADILLFRHLGNSSVLFITYISFFVAGMYIGDNIKTWIKNHTLEGIISLIISIILGYLFVRISFLSFAGKAVNDDLYNLHWYTYTLMASIFFMALSTPILKLHYLSMILIKAGKLSFGIYLMHPLVLDILTHLLKTGKPIIFDIYIIIEFIVILIISYIITKIIRKIPFGIFIVGK